MLKIHMYEHHWLVHYKGLYADWEGFGSPEVQRQPLTLLYMTLTGKLPLSHT